MDDYNSIVTHVIQVSPIMKIIRIKPKDWELPEYKSGQFIPIGLYPDFPRVEDSTPDYQEFSNDKLIKRAYSIASSSQQDFIEFYITLVHSGALTPRIFSLKVGDKIWMGKKATGMFTLDRIDENQNIVLIATGTGVAPYMSMLRSNILKRKGNVMVIHGAANSWDLGYSSELQLLASMFPNFYYHPTITEVDKEHADWSGDTRFIEEIWKTYVRNGKFEFIPKADNTHIFLCGNPNMVNGMVEMLKQENFVEHTRKIQGQIHIEKF